MLAGLFDNKIFTYVSYDGNKMNGCLVLLIARDQIGELSIILLFTWIDAHYPKLHNEFIKIAVQQGNANGVKKLIIITNRNEKMINRRIGKYGFVKTCSIYEKRIEDVI